MTIKRWILAGFAVGFLILMFVVWMAQVASSRQKAAQAQWQEKITLIRALTKNGTWIPSLELWRGLERHSQTFTDQWDALLACLKKSEHISSYANALEFKGDLFKMQRNLLAHAQALSIEIPPDIGFKQYTGKEIPPTSELATLSYELVMIKDFLELLMDCPVAQVKELERGPAGQRSIRKDEAPLYHDFSFTVRFHCSTQAFQKFLKQLLAPGSFFVMENLEVRWRSANALEVVGTVRAITFAAGKAATK